MYTEVINPIVTFFINSIGINAIYIGIDIFLPTSTLKVLFGCNGLEAILIFTAGILAFKADLKYKLKYLLQGILFISTVNIFRLVILAYVLEVHSNYFSLMHDYVTQHIMIFLAILLFLIFTSNVKEINKGK
jgi:exosortase/archaeosortase family protein